MAKVCCSKGHIYDTEIYGNSCPYCDNGAGHTIDFGTANDQMAGLGKSIAYSTLMPDDIKKTSAPTSYIREQEQLKKTVGVFVKKTGLDPIVGWLVCVEVTTRAVTTGCAPRRTPSAAARTWTSGSRATTPSPPTSTRR